MTQPYGEQRRGFFFWSLAPFLLVFIVAMPFLVPRRDASAMIALASVELLAVFVLLGLFNPRTFWWAWRGVGGIVFSGYSIYLVNMLIESGGRIELAGRRGEASARNALLGLIAFGLPGLWYALFGRLSFRRECEPDDEWQRLWDLRRAAIEEVLGPSDETVIHSPIPFDIGGNADVLTFSTPTNGITYVTASLIGDESSLPNEQGQYELMIRVPLRSDWAANLISQLARYTTEAVLSAGNTMDIRPALPRPTELSTLLFVTYSTISVEGQQASLLLCLGITDDELDFAHEHGSSDLVEKLKVAGVYPITDVARQSALKDS
jgi:hypothetical protein